jgi:hypothetical protein
MALSTVRSVKLTFYMGDLRLAWLTLGILPFHREHSPPPPVGRLSAPRGKFCFHRIDSC